MAREVAMARGAAALTARAASTIAQVVMAKLGGVVAHSALKATPC